LTLKRRLTIEQPIKLIPKKYFFATQLGFLTLRTGFFEKAKQILTKTKKNSKHLKITNTI